MRGPSRFRIDPNPPTAGGSVEVTYIGPSTEITWQVDDGDPTRVRPGADGKFRIDPVPSGDDLMISDGRGGPGYLFAEIVEADR